jgi:hypothetical protein
VTMQTIGQDLGGQLALSSQDQTVEKLIRWADGARAAHSLADALCRTPFCPKAFQGKPIEGAAAILAGSEVGLSPMAALKAFDVIEGAAAPRAITLRAIVQSRGHLLEVVESTASRCVIRGKRKGEDTWQESVWTIQRAQQMKLTGKDNWVKQPQGMLLARATAEISRMIASDAILGIAYTAEELTDDTSEDAAPARTRSVQRASKPELAAPTTPVAASSPSAGAPQQVATSPVGAPALPGEDAVVPVDSSTVSITAPQLKKLGATFTDLGVGQKDRAMRLAIVAKVIGRQVGSSSDLTKDEASALIDTLDANGAVIVGQFLDAQAGQGQAATSEPELPDPTDGNDPWAKTQ